MPPKTRRFLGVIYEKLYRNKPDDNFLVFEESDFVKAGSSVGEIEEILVFLKDRSVVADYGTYPVSRDIKRFPITREEKASRLRPSGWRKFLLLSFAPNKTKDRYVLELVSRDAFYVFYGNPSDQPYAQRSTSAVRKSVPKNNKFPNDLKWPELTLQFLNGEEAIVKYRGATFQTTAEEMGFLDKKTKTPNAQWRLMLQLASHGGEISWSNNADLPKNDIDTLKKRKQSLVAGLQEYFGISDDPFFPYREINAYRMKIKLIPENKGSGQSDDLGIQAFRKEQAPEVYEVGDFTKK